MGRTTRSIPARVRLWTALIVMAALLGTSCRSEEPRGDLEYLVWEVCRQVRVEGMTADQVGGILHDASRHGAGSKQMEPSTTKGSSKLEWHPATGYRLPAAGRYPVPSNLLSRLPPVSMKGEAPNARLTTTDLQEGAGNGDSGWSVVR